MSDEKKMTPENEQTGAAEAEKVTKPDTKSPSELGKDGSEPKKADKIKKRRILTAIVFAGMLLAALCVVLNLAQNPKKDEIPSFSESTPITASLPEESRATEAATSEVSAAGFPVGGEVTTTVETALSTETSPEESAAGLPAGRETTSAEQTTSAEESPTETSAPPATESTTASTTEPKKNGYTVVYSAGNRWENSGVQMTTKELKIENNTSGAVSGWKLELDIDGLKNVEGWNGTWKVSGNTLTITNADYNGDIPAGGAQVIGCNIGTASSLSIKSAKLNGKSCSVTKGKVDQNQQNQQNNDQNNNSNNNNNGGNSSVDVKALLTRNENAVQGDDWLHTDGNRILDKNGKQVWLTGVNWFGYNTGTNTFDGLWNSQLAPSVKAIADHGFNLIRVPISAELINQWAAGEYPRANYNNAYNQELNAMNSLEIFEYFLKLAEDNGIKVMPDIHSANTDASGHNANLWYTDRVSVDKYYSALEWMADRYKNNDTIIAFDLKNEPHGKPNEGANAAIWNDSKAKNNWKYTAETAAAKILAKNPNVLIMVEGTEIYPKDINKNGDYKSTNEKDYYFNWWGGNLRGVKDYPVNLGKYQNKLVYSPHDYGPTVYQQPWFKGTYTFESLMKDCWKDNWFYIHETGTAPLLIGEWGGFMREPNLTWMTYMRKLIKDNHLNHTFWCFNANSGDTGGLVLDDFTTWDDEKYNFVKEVLWQESGKFVGLDHAIKLGENGIALSSAKGL